MKKSYIFVGSHQRRRESEKERKKPTQFTFFDFVSIHEIHEKKGEITVSKPSYRNTLQLRKSQKIECVYCYFVMFFYKRMYQTFVYCLIGSGGGDGPVVLASGVVGTVPI